MLKTRVLTGAVIAAIICLVLLYSGNPWVLNTFIAVLSVQAVRELYQAVKLADQKLVSWVSYIAAAVIAFLPIPGYDLWIAVLFGGGILLFLYLMRGIQKLHSVRPWMAVLIALMIVSFYKSMASIRKQTCGLLLLALAMLACSVTDIGAYFVGRQWGKHKLAPVISPKKTVEGAVGGTLATLLAFLLAGWILNRRGVVSVHMAALAVYLLLAAVLGQFGDLAMSSVKRIVGIKDYGRLFPGHGGVLDRFDSLLFVLPFTYLFCTCIDPILADTVVTFLA